MGDAGNGLVRLRPAKNGEQSATHTQQGVRCKLKLKPDTQALADAADGPLNRNYPQGCKFLNAAREVVHRPLTKADLKEIHTRLSESGLTFQSGGHCQVVQKHQRSNWQNQARFLSEGKLAAQGAVAYVAEYCRTKLEDEEDASFITLPIDKGLQDFILDSYTRGNCVPEPLFIIGGAPA